MATFFIIAAAVGFVKYLDHRQKMAQIEASAGRGKITGRQDGIETLKRDLDSLRDTATSYDISFDAALQRLEQRVASVEKRVQSVETSADVSSTRV